MCNLYFLPNYTYRVYIKIYWNFIRQIWIIIFMHFVRFSCIISQHIAMQIYISIASHFFYPYWNFSTCVHGILPMLIPFSPSFCTNEDAYKLRQPLHWCHLLYAQMKMKTTFLNLQITLRGEDNWMMKFKW